jgi:RNA polymerase sigma-70 factor (ECF subfamily)
MTNTFQLLRSWHEGDRRALDALIEKHLGWVQDRVHQRLGPALRPAGDTQDFVQEAMVQVLEYGPRFELADEEHFRRLLARIVENTLRARHRFIHQQRRDVDREKPIGSGTVLRLDQPRDEVTRPSVHADRNERIAWVRLAMELLPPADREVLWMKDMDGLTFAQIGERLESKEDAMRMRYNRALPKLARKVAELKGGGLGDLLED